MFDRLANLLISWKIFRRCWNLLSLSLLVLMISWAVCTPAAMALLRQHHETPDVLRYHAQDSLKDSEGNTWQVLLFPDYTQGETVVYYLRLVGFPGVNAFKHPQSLEVLTAQGRILMVKDAYSESAPAPNVGQYDLTSLVKQLSAKQSLKLSVSLAENKKLALEIPQEVLLEWELLVQEIEH
ncbi:MAG: DUF3122 domain-containing protein [Cyanobacteria bacterium J06600_6]